jgi:drug/metabolite transporter (DMT)-like permease
MRVVGQRGESRESLAFWPRLLVAVAGLAMGCALGFGALPLKGLGLIICSGGIGGAGGWLCMAEAYKTAPASIVAPFHYSQIIVAALLGYAVWHDMPTLHLLLGVAIIIASGLYVTLRTRKTAGVLAEETHD